MRLRCALKDENETGILSFLIPLTLALSHPGEGIFRGMTKTGGRRI